MAQATIQSVVKKSTMLLVHKFDEDEIKDMTDNLTSQMMQVVSLEIEKKENGASFKRKIDQLKEQNNRLAVWLHDGEMAQDTAVEIIYNHPKDGTKTITRMDTNEKWEEPMDQNDNRIDNMVYSPDINDGSNNEEE